MKISFLLLCCLIAAIQCEVVLVSQSFQGNDFKDPDGWTAQGSARADLFNSCNGVKMFGGDQIFGTRSIALKNFQLPPHHSLQLKLQFWKVDSWDNEIAYVWVDDTIVWQRNFPWNQGTPMCSRNKGQGWTWEVVNIDITLKHTGPNAVVVITSNLDEDANNESWGFRDFQLFVDKCPENCSACQKDDTQATCQVWSPAFAFWTGIALNKPADTSCWNVVRGKAETTSCGGLELFGGYNKFGTKATISKQFLFPPHYKLKIKALFAKIDSWDNEIGYLKLDGTTIWQRNFQYNVGYAVSVCGNGWLETFARIEVDADHSADQGSLEVTTNLDEAPDNESWGVRDLYVFVAKCADNCARCSGPKPTDCQLCIKDWIIQGGTCVPVSNFILLESTFNEDKFTDISGWILKGNKDGNKVSECAGKSLLGGFNSMGAGATAEKTFTIPSHKRLRLSLQLYKIDSWDNEWMYIKVDGVEIYKQQWTVQTGGTSICGAAISVWNDAIFSVDEIFNHQAEKATVLFTSTLDQAADDGNYSKYLESWGFRQFKLFYEPYDQCAVFFTQYEFKGEAYEFCAKSPNFLKDKVPPKIRSIKVPPQGKVTLYQSLDYSGKKVVFTSDQPYINEQEFSFLESAHVEGQEWIEVPLNDQLD